MAENPPRYGTYDISQLSKDEQEKVLSQILSVEPDFLEQGWVDCEISVRYPPQPIREQIINHLQKRTEQICGPQAGAKNEIMDEAKLVIADLAVLVNKNEESAKGLARLTGEKGSHEDIYYYWGNFDRIVGDLKRTKDKTSKKGSSEEEKVEKTAGKTEDGTLDPNDSDSDAATAIQNLEIADDEGIRLAPKTTTSKKRALQETNMDAKTLCKIISLGNETVEEMSTESIKEMLEQAKEARDCLKRLNRLLQKDVRRASIISTKKELDPNKALEWTRKNQADRQWTPYYEHFW